MKNWLKRTLKSRLKSYWEKYDTSVDYREFEEKHIKNLTPLVNRTKLLQKMPSNGIVAEIGVDQGSFSRKILDITSPAKLHLVDFWGSKRYHTGKKLEVEQKFENLIKDGKVEINLGLSTDVASSFADNYFDWIYIDTDHTYKTTLAELNLYHKKVKSGGIIAGHDYEIGNWNTMSRYGVKEAVVEFCIKNDWQLKYLTFENKGFPSFAIQKI